MKEEYKQILLEYANSKEEIVAFTSKIEHLLSELIKENKLKIHSISSRVKDEVSLNNKIADAGSKYNELKDITDVSGIRIITYFEDEVDEVAKTIEIEFNIDWANSVDKRVLMEPDRFGYLSLHYVCQLSDSRLQLTEYKRYETYKTEIQIRSILQHSWAEIEHDLGYKSEELVPKEIKRRFSRLAGLLEIADAEFVQIRDELQRYSEELPGKIKSEPDKVLIDKASVHVYVSTQKSYSDRLRSLASEIGIDIAKDTLADVLVPELKFCGFSNIKDIDLILEDEGPQILGLIKAFIKKSNTKSLSKGLILFYACYYMAAKSGGLTAVINFMNEFNLGLEENREAFAKKIMSAYANASKTSA